MLPPLGARVPSLIRDLRPRKLCSVTKNTHIHCSLLFRHSVISDSFVIPWTVAHQAPLSTGFSRQKYWSGWPCPPPGNSWPKDWTCSSAWQADLLLLGSTHIHTYMNVYTAITWQYFPLTWSLWILIPCLWWPISPAITRCELCVRTVSHTCLQSSPHLAQCLACN